MLSCASARYLWLKLANVKVSDSTLTYNQNNGLFSCLVQCRSKTQMKVYISVPLHIKLVKRTLIKSYPAVYEQCWSSILSSAWPYETLRSIHPRFKLPTVFFFLYKSLHAIFNSHLVAFCVQNLVKTSWDKVLTAVIVRQSNSLGGAGLTDMSIIVI